MAAARASGNKLVALAVAGTVSAVGIGTIYLPFMADRDKMRGLHEEENMKAPTAAMLAAETKKLQDAGLLKKDDDLEKDTKIPSSASSSRSSAGSMWSNFRNRN